MTANKNKVSFGGDRNVLELDGGVMVAQPCEYTENCTLLKGECYGV